MLRLRPAAYRFGEMEADFGRAELRRAGKLVDPTPIEFKLLTVSIRGPQPVLKVLAEQ